MLSCAGEYPFVRSVSRLDKSAKYSLLSFAFMVCIARSTSPLDCAHSGDDVTCSNPQRTANSLNSVDALLWAAVSDKGIAYTMCTEHFLHSRDGLSSIDTFLYTRQISTLFE